MQAQIRAAQTTSALTYSVSMSIEHASASDDTRAPSPARKTNDATGIVGPPASMLEVVPTSELASPLAPVRNVSFRPEGQEHGDTTAAESIRPLR